MDETLTNILKWITEWEWLSAESLWFTLCFSNQFNQYYLCSDLQQWVIENGETDRFTADAATVSRTVEGRGPMK